jgi:hypothetical protein
MPHASRADLSHAFCSTVANPEIRLQGRISSCGPRPGALLILTPLAVHATASPHGRPATNARSLTAVGGPDSSA